MCELESFFDGWFWILCSSQITKWPSRPEFYTRVISLDSFTGRVENHGIVPRDDLNPNVVDRRILPRILRRVSTVSYFL